MVDAPPITGLAIDLDHHVTCQTPVGTFTIGMSPEELRALAAALVNAAAALEAEAAQAASDAIRKAGRLA